MPRMTDPEALELARSLRPQAFGGARPDSVDDPIVEPLWPGVRVLAAVGDGRAELFDEQGALVDALPGLTTILGRSLAAGAGAAILDGYLTKQAVTESGGVRVELYELPSFGDQVSRLFIGSRRYRMEQTQQRREAEMRDATFAPEDLVNLVATDLLWLDREWLTDVPLLERRRVLESVLPDTELVRTGMFVRPPYAKWLGSWRAQGFRGLTFKAANSRYRPGETARDWVTAPMPRR